MALTFRQLRYFLVLSEELHFGRAAKRLHISQPPLSASLKQLEDDLGARLLDRSGKQVVLTPAGELFRQQAGRLLNQLGDARDMVRRLGEASAGRLRVGFTPTMLFRKLPDMLAAFRQQYPDVELQLIEHNSAGQLEALALGRIDVGFIHALPLPDSVASLTIAEEPFVCCLPSGHTLAARERIALEELADAPLVMFSRSLAAHYHDRIMSLFRMVGAEPLVRHEVSQWLTIVAMVANGMGVALVPRALVNAGLSGVVFLPLANADIRHRSCCIWQLATGSPLRDALLDCVRAHG
ncbi:MAG: LysR family transcriptional regulator [Ectothiorhodospiraceae bacterium]|nr:LysR family transcriptional regulator [Ectothiorhodospiraceae bacterium]MCH8504925.1 LysR family transcriptional regulator [Ectothiorhodospiraceae bacterium]